MMIKSIRPACLGKRTNPPSIFAVWAHAGGSPAASFVAKLESANIHDNPVTTIMRMTILVVAFTAMLIAPAMAQKAEIEAVNAKWVDFFNKGDFAGLASLYTEDATAFPLAPEW